MNIAVIWGIIYLATKPMEQSTGIVNFAAIVKILMAFALLVGAVVYIIGGGEVKNDFSSGELMPSYGEAMIFIPALIYNFLGFEIMSAAGGSIKNPARDVPRAAFVNVIMIITLNLIAVIGVLVVLPKDSVNIITGVIDAFRASFGETGLAAVVIYLIGFLYLCVLVAQSLMWMLGTAQVAVESAKNNEMPKVLAKIHPKNNTPTGSLIVGGVISTVVTTASTLTAGSAEQMFWAIFACTSILLLIPYFLCFEAYLKLKREDKETPRPYVFPGPDWLVKTLIRIAQFIILCTILFFVWVPGQPVEWTQVIFIAVGIILTLGSGEFLIRNSMRKNYSTNEVTE
ncbi:amino acid transporter [Yokenella regensburgei]|nr:amino acid transporter [Yokenella regensburgei]